MLVVPVRKSGGKTKTSKYRPISLTSTTCKIFEHVIYSNIMRHLEKHTIIDDVQHDSRSGASCSTLLVQFYNDLLLAVESGDEID